MANSSNAPFTVAAVQATPVFLDREATLDKACDLIAKVGRAGASLAVFPEAFIPAYPDWAWAIPPSEGGLLSDLYARLLANAVDIPGPATERLCQAAKSAGLHLIMGVNERNAEASGSSLYNTLLVIDAQGQILGLHRKLVPTAAERLVWARGDGSTLDVYDTPFGKLGALICWENYMPLARYALYAWGTQIYAAPTWDRGEPWLSTLRHIAKEGRVYVIGCCMPLRKDDIPDHFEFKERFYGDAGEWINEGDSAILNPSGEFIDGPLHQEEGILYAEVDPSRMRGPRWMLDVAGHYARPDVFELIVHREARPVIRGVEQATPGDNELEQDE